MAGDVRRLRPGRVDLDPVAADLDGNADSAEVLRARFEPVVPALDSAGADGERVVAFLDLVDEVDAEAAQRRGERAEGAAAHLA